jgi:hypothetical protein
MHGFLLRLGISAVRETELTERRATPAAARKGRAERSICDGSSKLADVPLMGSSRAVAAERFPGAGHFPDYSGKYSRWSADLEAE